MRIKELDEEIERVKLFHKKHGINKETIVNDIRNIHYKINKPRSELLKLLIKQFDNGMRMKLWR